MAEIILRYKKTDVIRSVPVPGGKVGMWITVTLGVVGVLLTIIVSIIPSSDIPQDLHTASLFIQIIGVLLLFVAPLIIYKFKKESWKKQIKQGVDE